MQQGTTLDFGDLREEIHGVFTSNANPGADEVNSVLKMYQSNPNDWEKYIKIDPDNMPNRYTRHLVDAGNGKFNILILVWQVGQASPIHDHHNSDCSVKVLENTLMETRFETPSPSSADQKMKQLSQKQCKVNDVTHIHDNMNEVHRMENPTSTGRTVSLHVYWPPFDTCNKFEESTGTKQEAHITYDSCSDRSVNRHCGN